MKNNTKPISFTPIKIFEPNWYRKPGVIAQSKNEITRAGYCKSTGLKIVGIKMIISVENEDEVENEFDVVFCCEECFGCSPSQYKKMFMLATSRQTIKIPNCITSSSQFIEWYKNQ